MYYPKQYKKSWTIMTRIARDILCLSLGDQLPTVQEFSERYQSSRGIVQNALKELQDSDAITIEKRGKVGCFLTAVDGAKLFDAADLQYITGSMPPPFTDYHSSLATAVCSAFKPCPVTFNFAFMHSSDNRLRALQRVVYDFVIVSLHAAKALIKKCPDVEIAMVFDHCLYAPQFMLYSNIPGAMEITDGASVAVDPNSSDQYEITMKLCQGKQVNFICEPYIKSGDVFASGRADFVVFRNGERKRLAPAATIQIPQYQDEDMTIPAILVSKKRYALDRILAKYLSVELIHQVQQEVLSGQRGADFY